MHVISSDSKLRWLQQVLLVVSMDKAMPEHLKVSEAVDETTTQQGFEGTSEATVTDGKGRMREGTLQSDCVCG